MPPENNPATRSLMGDYSPALEESNVFLSRYSFTGNYLQVNFFILVIKVLVSIVYSLLHHILVV